MNTIALKVRAGLFLVAAISLKLWGQNLQPVSVAALGSGPPPGANGDSVAPLLSGDGRYVLFASTADNLILGTNQLPLAIRLPAALNVYLRDRSNQTTLLVSADRTGAPGAQGDSLPLGISTNGRFVLFQSGAPGLVSADTNNAVDVFIRDIVLGETVPVSVNTNGYTAAGASRDAVMTPDGRYIAFVSAANDLVGGDTNRIADVFVRDRVSGTTVLASVGAQRTNAVPMASSEAPHITPDGRYVAFFSTATNLVPGVPLGGDVYVRDLVAGKTMWASVAARAQVRAAFGVTNAVSYNHVLSEDGQYLVYEASPPGARAGLILRYGLTTGATDLVCRNATVQTAAYENIRNVEVTPDGSCITFIAHAGDLSNATSCVEVWDARTGLSVIASVDLSGEVPTNTICDWPKIDSTGRYVTFLSSAANLVTNPVPAGFHLYVRDLQAAAATLVDPDLSGLGTPLSPACVPSISTDARLVAFESPDGDLVPHDRNRATDIFVRDWAAGSTELCSPHVPALSSSLGNGPSALTRASLSADGSLVAFTSEADDLIPDDDNRVRDVFVRDLTTQTTILISANTNGLPGDGISTGPAISADGGVVVFSSYADDLVTNDMNRARDIFLRDVRTGTTSLMSVNAKGTGPGNRESFSPLISFDGRYVLFGTLAQDLGVGTFSGNAAILRDRESGTNYLVSQASTFYGFDRIVMTPDARRVFYTSSAAGKNYVWDRITATTLSTNSTLMSGAFSIAISPDGERAAFGSGTGLYLEDIQQGTTQALETTGLSYLGLNFSGDGRTLVFSKRSTTSLFSQVYLYQLDSGEVFLISHAANSTQPGGGNSDSPQLSPDGRLIAFRSTATNLIGGSVSGQPQVYLFDRQSGTTMLLSVNASTGGSSGGFALLPVFSGNGQTVCFQNWGSDVTAHNFSQMGDVFAYTLFNVTILGGAGSGQGPWLSWPYVPDQSYHVQYKDVLDWGDWQELGGTITNDASRAYFQDASAGLPQRFYRVVNY